MTALKTDRIMNAEELARKTLEAAGVWAEVYADMNYPKTEASDYLPLIRVEIEWGDWKHDHLRADRVLQAAGFTSIGQEVTEDDESDIYSAIHSYIAPMN